MAVRTLLFGDDGSEEADRVWQWIVAQKWDSWRARILMAMPPEIPTQISAPDADKPHPWTPSKPRVAPDSTGFLMIEHLIAEVDPRIALQECTDVSLIVVGPRGTGAMKALGIGSTTEYLLSGAPAPLLIARGEKTVKSVLVCADGSSYSIQAAKSAAMLPWISSTEATLITVNPKLGHNPEGIERAASIIETSGARLNKMTGEGKVTRAILEAATKTGTDLIVVGTRSLTGFRKVLLGSTASWLARHAETSVLVAFPDET